MPFSISKLALVALSALLIGNTQAASLASRATKCNGYPELCSKTYGTVAYVGTHNSYAIGTNNLAVNQDQSIETQLNDGVRLLQVQAHNQNGTIQLCHSDCRLYDGGSFEDYLKKVKTWLDANPEEVVTILVVNINNLPATSFAEVYSAAGLESISYAPEAAVIPASGWPTLGSMIDSGKRLVTFLDNAASFEAVPWLLDEFTNVWETAFNVLNIEQFDCTVNRTKGDTSTQMFLINQFLNKQFLGQPVPDVDRANTTNAASGPGSLGAHVETCVAVHSRPPNFLLVDFYEYGAGSVFEVAAGINGVTYTKSPTLASPIPISSGSSSTGGTKNTGTSNPGNGAPMSVSWSRVGVVLGSIAFGSLMIL